LAALHFTIKTKKPLLSLGQQKELKRMLVISLVSNAAHLIVVN